MNGAPERLGRYELLARLATGGMGEVFLARLEGAEGFEKLYAVKRVQDAGTVDFGINAPEDDGLISAAAPKLRLCNARFPGKDTEIVVVLDVAPDGKINPPVRYEPESYQGTLLGDCLQKALAWSHPDSARRQSCPLDCVPAQERGSSCTRREQMTDRFDLCVLGAGPAGIAGAIRGADLGLRVALIDGGPLGGAGIFDGALSSKTLWHLAGDYSRASRRDRGYDGAGLVASWREVRAEVSAACNEAQALLETQLVSLSIPAPGRGSIERIVGRGVFIARDVIQVALAQGGERTVASERFLLGVGSKPRVPPGFAVDGVRVVTSDHIEHLSELPKRLAIVGAGVVGCEYATIFAHLRATTVEMFDRQPRILPFEDEDVSAVVAQRFSEIGVHVHRRAKIEKAVTHDAGVDITWRDENDQVQTRTYDRVLVATGRAPATAGLGLEHPGVAVDPQSSGVRTEGCRTSAPHVWAAGDVTPDLMLANLAELEGRHAVEDMGGLDPPPIVHEAQSAIYFLSPEVASVGLDEQMARAKNVRYRAAIVENSLNRRNLAMRSTAGFVKLLARPDGRLLGLRVVGPQAGTCIQGVALLIGQGGTLDAVDRCVHPHPAVTEGVLEAARLLLGTSLYKPEAMGGRCRIVTG